MKNLKDAILYFHEEGQPFYVLSYNDDKAVKLQYNNSIQTLDMNNLDADLSRLLTMVESQKRSLCFYPNGSKKVENIQNIRWHFVDIDSDGGNKDEQWERILSAPLPPTLVYRGRAGHKVLYEVSNAFWDSSSQEAIEVSKDRYKNINEQLVSFFKADPAVNTPQYPLRLPFTNNYKYWREQVVTEEVVLFKPENVYTQEELVQAFPKAETQHEPRIFIFDYDEFPKEQQEALALFSDYMDEAGLMQIDRGDRISVQCPIHDDSSPSAVLFKSKLHFHCSSKEKCEVGNGKSLRWIAEYMDWEELVLLLDKLEQTKHKKYENITLDTMGSSDYVPMEAYSLMDCAHTEKILRNIHDVMSSRGVISDANSGNIYRSVINFAYSNQNKALVCPLEPGGGKSTLMETLVKYRLQNDIENAGCIIAVERIETAKQLAEIFGEYRTRVDWNPDIEAYPANKSAYVMESAFTFKPCKKNLTEYEFGVCRGCPEQRKGCPIPKKYEDQMKHPIVIVSHSRLTMDGGGLNKYKTWKNLDGKKYERNLLIVDEKPALVTVHKLGLGDLDTFLFNVNTIAMHICSSKVELISRTITQLREAILNCVTTGGMLKPIASDFSFDIQSVWYKHYQGKNVGILSQLEYLLQTGGRVTKDSFGDHIAIYFSQNHCYTFEEFTTLILDGTATNDMEYSAAENIGILQTPRVRDYGLLTFYVAPLTMNKTAFARKPELIDMVINNVRNLAEDQKILVLCFKQHKRYLEEKLMEEIKQGTVMVNNYGNVKGSNKYADCTCLVLAGIQNKGDAYYISKFEKIYETAPESGILLSEHHTRRFKDLSLERFKLNDQLIDTIQDICRVGIRNRSNKYPIHVYIPTKDKVFIKLLQEYFIGLTCDRWLIEESMPKWYLKCKEYFSMLPAGYKLKKSELKSLLQLESSAGKKQFQRIQKHELFQSLLEEYNIMEVNARTYTKAAVQVCGDTKDMVLI